MNEKPFSELNTPCLAYLAIMNNSASQACLRGAEETTGSLNIITEKDFHITFNKTYQH